MYIFIFILFRIDFPISKQWRPWSGAAFSDLGLPCLLMSQKWLIWVKKIKRTWRHVLESTRNGKFRGNHQPWMAPATNATCKPSFYPYTIRALFADYFKRAKFNNTVNVLKFRTPIKEHPKPIFSPHLWSKGSNKFCKGRQLQNWLLPSQNFSTLFSFAKLRFYCTKF